MILKLLQGKAYHGYYEVKKAYFYGFRVQLIVTAANHPVDYFITAGSFHDVTALQAMPVDLPPGSERYADYVQEVELLNLLSWLEGCVLNKRWFRRHSKN